jgi:NTE family protein
LSHIGVLKALRDKSIKVDFITGSSIGAVIGAMYAATLDPDWVETRFREFLKSDLYQSIGLDRINSKKGSSFFQSITKPVKDMVSMKIVNDRLGLLKSKRLVSVLEYLLPVKYFNELKIPFKCISVNLNNGQDVIFDSGDLVQAVTASSSIPGYMQPVIMGDMMLVDGAVSMPYPVRLLKEMGADVTVAIDINIRKFVPFESPNLLQILSRTDQITSIRLNSYIKNETDVLLYPDTGNVFWAEFEKIDLFIEKGYEVVCNNLSKIQSKLNISIFKLLIKKLLTKFEK